MAATWTRNAWLAALAAIAMVTSPASGQVVTNPTQNGGAVLPNPLLNQPVTGSNLTPEQMQSIMMMRALQSRGRGQVRTGYPQFIPLGMGPGMMGPVYNGADQQPQKTSAQRRAEARKLNKRVEKPKVEKPKADKAKGKAKAEKKPVDKKPAAAKAKADE